MKNILSILALLVTFITPQISFGQPDPPQGCIDVFLINPDIIYTAEYDPVCGCDGITYSNACVAINGYGVTEWTPGECSEQPDCMDVAGIDFGLCDMVLGIALLNGNCTTVSGCGYVVDNVDYTDYFFVDEENCIDSCEENDEECMDLVGIDFGDCEMILGIALYNNSCQMISGCGYIVDNVDYSNYFFESEEECQVNCENQVNCFDFLNLDFGECDLYLGAGVVDGICTDISGCSYIINNVDYTDYFYSNIEDCLENCGGVMECIDTDLINDIACDTDYTPVCGCDGITYNNYCEAENWYGITEWTSGPCEPVNECMDLGNIDFGECTAVLGITLYNGACVNISGCGYVVNNVDYSDYFFESIEDCLNLCETTGCINESQIDSMSICPTVVIPVCGCDNITYNNACEAENWYGVTEWTDGPCDPIGECMDLGNIDFGVCTAVLGITLYNGSCMNISGCGYVVNNVDYSDYFFETIEDCLNLCETSGCINESLIDSTIFCTTDYNPVCGCDNITYNNSCEASNWYGVTEWTTGACDSINDCMDLGDVDFGDCDMVLGVGLINGQCINISGCDYLVNNVDYSEYFYDSIDTCAFLCESTDNISNSNELIFNVYPNPASDLVNIKFDSNINKSINLINYQGQMVFTKETTNSTVQIDVNKISKGIYLLKIIHVNGSHSVKRIIIK